MDAGDDGFLKRWSRLKSEARAELPQPATEAEPPAKIPAPEAEADEPPAVPPLDSLTLDSDYRPFFHPKIEEGLRRAALKKLFGDPHFNVMDGLDVYIDDYSKSEPLPVAALGELEQAKKILAWAREDTEERARREAERRDAAARSEENGVASADHGRLREAPESAENAAASALPVDAKTIGDAE